MDALCWLSLTDTVVVVAHTETEDEIHIMSKREAENHEKRKLFSNF
jgi:hypothetical protein